MPTAIWRPQLWLGTKWNGRRLGMQLPTREALKLHAYLCLPGLVAWVLAKSVMLFVLRATVGPRGWCFGLPPPSAGSQLGHGACVAGQGQFCCVAVLVLVLSAFVSWVCVCVCLHRASVHAHLLPLYQPVFAPCCSRAGLLAHPPTPLLFRSMAGCYSLVQSWWY